MKTKKPLFYVVITTILTLVFVSILFLKTNIKDTIDGLFNDKDTICTAQIYMEDAPSLWEPTSTGKRVYAIDSEGNIPYNENWWDKRFPVSATYDKKNVKQFFKVLKSVDPIYDSRESGLENYADVKRKNSIIVMYTDKDGTTSKTITLTEKDFNKVISEANNLVIPILPSKVSTDKIDTEYVDDEFTEESHYSTDMLDAVVGENAFIITLYPDKAPITCENFEKLVKEGFYDGLTFHRVIDDFMAQAGDNVYRPANGIIGEFGAENNLSHQRGVVSMAHVEDDYNSAYGDFFISYDDNSFLDGSYAAFGEVTDGMSVVDSFLNVARKEGDDGALSIPIEPIVMEKVIMIDNDKNGNPRVEIIMSK